MAQASFTHSFSGNGGGAHPRLRPEKGLKAGILYLKGGELADEILPLKQQVRVYELKDVFKEEFFETKKVVHVVL